MKRRLSAPFATFFFKFIFSTIWIGGFGLGTLVNFLSGQDDKWVFLFAWLVGSLIIYRIGVRLKVVAVDDNFIYISNYIKTISVPLSEIDKIWENLVINIHPIYIKFKHDTFFGQKIMFTPKGLYILRNHPIVRELGDLVQKQKGRHDGRPYIKADSSLRSE